MTPRLLIPLSLAAAVWLTLCDQLFHVRTETLVYHWTPQLADQHLLVPVTFFLGGLGMLVTADRSGVGGRPGGRSLAIDFGIVTGAYLLSGVLDPDLAIPYAVALLAIYLVRVAARGEHLRLIVVGVAIAVSGVLAEAALSAAGQFDYLHPDILGVPWWLGPLYLHGSLVAVDLVAAARQASTVSRS